MSRHVSRPILAIAAASAAALAILAGPASAQSTVNYVALGDSYASGVGSGPYISASGSCDQSNDAYPALWAAANAPASYVSEACSGATTTSVQSSQLSALSSSTTLVSLTVGGNDADFSSVMETCNILFFSTSSCVNAIDQAEAQAEANLPGDLDSLLSAIKTDAPNATVVVLDYPHFYDLSKSSSCAGLSTTDRTDIDQGIDLIDGMVQTAAAQYGDVFADVRTAFSGHEICDSDSWLNSVDWTDFTSSYHPTAAGQADGYLPVFSAAAAG
jgi:lysophospholipase L1-like esterase